MRAKFQTVNLDELLRESTVILDKTYQLWNAPHSGMRFPPDLRGIDSPFSPGDIRQTPASIVPSEKQYSEGHYETRNLIVIQQGAHWGDLRLINPLVCPDCQQRLYSSDNGVVPFHWTHPEHIVETELITIASNEILRSWEWQCYCRTQNFADFTSVSERTRNLRTSLEILWLLWNQLSGVQKEWFAQRKVTHPELNRVFRCWGEYIEYLREKEEVPC